MILVGSVRNTSTSATNVNYSVGDGTGYLDVRQWLDSADDESGKMDGIGSVIFLPLRDGVGSCSEKRGRRRREKEGS